MPRAHDRRCWRRVGWLLRRPFGWLIGRLRGNRGASTATAAALDRNRGMVTAETALALPALALVVGLMLWALLTAIAQLRCVDAARAAARSVARGDGLAESVAAGRRLAPAGAHIRVERSGGLVRVNVEARVGPAGSGAGFLPTLAVSADAVVADEQG